MENNNFIENNNINEEDINLSEENNEVRKKLFK